MTLVLVLRHQNTIHTNTYFVDPFDDMMLGDYDMIEQRDQTWKFYMYGPILVMPYIGTYKWHTPKYSSQV